MRGGERVNERGRGDRRAEEEGEKNGGDRRGGEEEGQKDGGDQGEGERRREGWRRLPPEMAVDPTHPLPVQV